MVIPRTPTQHTVQVCMTHPHSAQTKQGDGSIYAALAKVAPYGEAPHQLLRAAQPWGQAARGSCLCMPPCFELNRCARAGLC